VRDPKSLAVRGSRSKERSSYFMTSAVGDRPLGIRDPLSVVWSSITARTWQFANRPPLRPAHRDQYTDGSYPLVKKRAMSAEGRSVALFFGFIRPLRRAPFRAGVDQGRSGVPLEMEAINLLLDSSRSRVHSCRGR